MSTLRVRANLDAVPAYKQGRSAPTDSSHETFKISSNENPYPPLPSVVAAIADDAATVNRYPETSASALTGTIASRFGVTAENIIFGAGSVESVSQIIRATSGPGDEVVFAWRSFEAYPMLVQAAGARSVKVPLTDTHVHDLPAMLAAITDHTSLIVVCNPNNPTGATVGDAELRTFLDAVPAHITVLIDEAYVHFNRREGSPVGIDLFRAYPNIVVAHTFSKAYGLAGIRIGYAIGPAEMVTAMRKVAIPFGVTTLAQVAASASLAADDELQERVESLLRERDRVVAELTADRWSLPPSQTNFLWLPFGASTVEASNVFDEHGLIVRTFPGEGIRATIAESEANDRLIAAMKLIAERGLDNGLAA